MSNNSTGNMTGRPSEKREAAVSAGGGGKARSAVQGKGAAKSKYEADAQALADVWDPKKRAERLARQEAEEQRAREAASGNAQRPEAGGAKRRNLDRVPEINPLEDSSSGTPSGASAGGAKAQQQGRRKRRVVLTGVPEVFKTETGEAQAPSPSSAGLTAVSTASEKPAANAAAQAGAVENSTPVSSPVAAASASDSSEQAPVKASNRNLAKNIHSVFDSVAPTVEQATGEQSAGGQSKVTNPQAAPKQEGAGSEAVVRQEGVSPEAATQQESAEPEVAIHQEGVSPEAAAQSEAASPQSALQSGDEDSQPSNEQEKTGEPDGSQHPAEQEEAGETENSQQPSDQEGENPQDKKRPSANPHRRTVGSQNDQGDAAGSKGKRTGITALKVVLIVVVVIAVILAGIFGYAALSRWCWSDDASDIQGSWRMSGESAPVSISADSINLNSQVTYGYTLDTQAKVIDETLGNMTGSARYRFSGDRNSLAIFDDGSNDWWQNAMTDLAWYKDCLIAQIFGSTPPDLLGGESGVILYRSSLAASASDAESTE